MSQVKCISWEIQNLEKEHIILFFKFEEFTTSNVNLLLMINQRLNIYKMNL